MSFEFREVSPDDFALLSDWRRRPHVARWWGETSAEDLLKEFEKEIADPLVELYIAVHKGQDIGFVQACDAFAVGDGWWPDAAPGTWAIDYLIGEPDFIGKGLGSALISAFTDRLFSRADIRTVTADPEPGNTASIRACQKAGFTKTGIVDTPDGPAMLMQRTRT